MATHCHILFVCLLLLTLWGPALNRPPPPTRPSHLPKEVSWEAWLLLDDLTPTTERRIRPKSVFIAPSFSLASLPSCAEGYRTDAMGRCVKIVRVNQAAQLDFLLGRLNAMYANPEKVSSPQPQTDGPLQVNIPITVSDPQPDKPDKDDSDSNNSVEMAAFLADVVESKDDRNHTKIPQTILAVWNMSSDTSSQLNISNPQFTNTSKTPPTFSNSNSPAISDVDGSGELESLPNLETEDIIPNVLWTAPSTVLVQEMEPSPTVPHQDTKKENVSENRKLNKNSTEVKKQTHDENTTKQNDPMFNWCSDGCIEPDPDKDIETTSKKQESYHKTTTTEKKVVEENITNSLINDNLVMESQNSVFSESVSWDKHNSRRTTTTRPQVSAVQNGHVPGHVRFPSHEFSHETETYHNRRYHNVSPVRFPEDNIRDRGPVVFPHQEQQSFWWLPQGWTLDQTRHHPVLLKFWAHAPLTRYFSSAEYPRQHHRRKYAYYSSHYSSEIGKK